MAAVGALMVAALPFALPARADGLPDPLANFMGSERQQRPDRLSSTSGPCRSAVERPAAAPDPSNIPSANWPKSRDATVLRAAKADFAPAGTDPGLAAAG